MLLDVQIYIKEFYTRIISKYISIIGKWTDQLLVVFDLGVCVLAGLVTWLLAWVWV